MKVPHILIFDSGAGGLSVAREIIAKNVPFKLTYVADNKHFPYGVSPPEDLFEQVINSLGRSIKRKQPDIVVIACNTVSTLLLPKLRELYEIPFVGVVPAIKPAARDSQTGVIAVLATGQTISRRYTLQLIEDFAAQRDVILHPAPLLVEAAENFILYNQDPTSAVKCTLQELELNPLSSEIDTVVLACTHFPLLRESIASHLPGIRLVDSGEAIANRVFDILGETSESHAFKKDHKSFQLEVLLTSPNQQTEAAYAFYLNNTYN